MPKTRSDNFKLIRHGVLPESSGNQSTLLSEFVNDNELLESSTEQTLHIIKFRD